MYILFEAKMLNIESLHLALTAIGVIIPITLTLIGLNISRKKDLHKSLEKKADVAYVDKQDDHLRSEMKLHDEKYDYIKNILELILTKLINK